MTTEEESIPDIERWKKCHETHFPHLNMNGHWARFMKVGATKEPQFRKSENGVAMLIRYDWGMEEWCNLGELMRTGAFANSFAGFQKRKGQPDKPKLQHSPIKQISPEG